MTTGDASREPLVYRPFALLAFGATVAAGTPIGIWMLAWLYLGAPPVPVAAMLLHAHLQIVGFFATLIVGVAPHLLARFSGRALASSPVDRLLVGALGTALVLRIVATGAAWTAGVVLAAVLQAAAFLIVAARVWRALAPPPLAFLRRHLALSTLWLAAACLLEAIARGRASGLGLALPDPGAMRVVHAMALSGGILGWMLGVLLRAGPMFVADWSVSPRIARAIPGLLALGIVLIALGEAGGWGPAARVGLARAGEVVALGTTATVMIASGAWRRARRALPMLVRSRQEARIFRLAVGSGSVAALGAVTLASAAILGVGVAHAVDALRHLFTVGFLGGVVVAMAFRLIPVLEGRALPWPALRAVAFWALLGSVLLRGAEVLVPYGLGGVAPAVVLSGILAWIALASVAVTLIGAMTRSPARS